MIRRIQICLLAAVLGISGAWDSAHAARRVVRVGFVADGPSVRNEEWLGHFKREIGELLGGEFDVRFPAALTREGDWTSAGVAREFNALISNAKVGAIVTMGPIAAQVASRRKRLRVPTIAPFVLDRTLQKLPYKDGASGVRNLNYLTSTADIGRVVEILGEITPFRNLVLVGNQAYLETLGLGDALMRENARKMGARTRIVAVGKDVAEALSQIPDDADAVVVSPQLQLSDAEYRELAEGLIERGLPSISIIGRREVEYGILASVSMEDQWPRVARRVALNLQRALLGEDLGKLPVSFVMRERLFINLETARRIGRWPPWKILAEAELINEEVDAGNEITLDQVVRNALEANIDYQAEKAAVRAGEQRVSSASSSLLPQLELSATGRVIDDDRAAASLGSAPERSIDGTARLTQLLYGDDAWAGYTIEQRLQESREEKEREVRLDVALQASTAYLNLARAQTVRNIQRENLKVTRSSLELAQIRKEIGASGPGEVYRWESQIATDRQSVIEAESRVELARNELNRVLHLPLEAPTAISEVDLQSLELIAFEPGLQRFVSDPWSYRIFRDFMVKEGVSAVPELKQFDAAIAAKERELDARFRRYWLPTLAAQGEVSQNFAKGGAGSGGGAAIPGFVAPDDTAWSVGLSARWTLDRAVHSEHRRVVEELLELKSRREALVERLEQRIRASLHNVGFTFPSIELSQQAAEAAQKNLELVVDAYSRGVVSILELLDAQNAALASRELASNATHEFLLDLMEMQRATGQFDFFVSQQERIAFLKRLEQFYDNARTGED